MEKEVPELDLGEVMLCSCPGAGNPTATRFTINDDRIRVQVGTHENFNICHSKQLEWPGSTLSEYPATLPSWVRNIT
jgi:hypothetical protein